jgi:uncharacterized protein DUF4105
MSFKKILFFLFLTYGLQGTSQTPELSLLSKISVLTSGPGDILYSAFGHSAFRVQDVSQGIDVVYNYGVFDTSGENFYLKFSKGRMDYKLERRSYKSYLRSYEIENRWVNEQILDLSVPEKNKLFKFLEINNLPENKVYQYDYFLNNCATKIWEVLKHNFGEQLFFDETYITNQFTFRELIRQNIKTNSWGAFGIDLALGSVIDRKATPKEHLYLPDYVMWQLKVAHLNDSPITIKEESLLETGHRENTSSFFTSPLFFILIISIGILIATYFDFIRKRRRRWLDFGIFLFTGSAGLVLFFLWFMTDHIWTVGNYNILWVFPLNFILAFLILRKPIAPWVRKYTLGLVGLLLLMILLWMFSVQAFTPVLIPLLVALATRYLYIGIIFQNNKP